MCNKGLLWDKSWEPFFNEHEKMLEDILYRVGKEAFFPEIEKVFRFTAIAPDKVNGVVVGMDPYPTYTIDEEGKNVPEATGRSFEVASVGSWQQKIRQSSLRNLLKAIYVEATWAEDAMYKAIYPDSVGAEEATLDEIRSAMTTGRIKIPPPHEWFNLMEGRGIMFLNLGLTVEPGKPGSHVKLWEPFTKDVVTYIKENSPGAVWMLFGKNAQDALYEKVRECEVICTCHPRLPGFVKERPLRKIKKII